MVFSGCSDACVGAQYLPLWANDVQIGGMELNCQDCHLMTFLVPGEFNFNCHIRFFSEHV